MDNINDLLRKRKKLLEEIDKEIQNTYTKAVSLLFTDIVGSTQYFEEKGDIAGRQMIQTHNDLLFPVIRSFEGRIIKTIGDSIMASFEDPVKSVTCAVRMQETLKQYNNGKTGKAQLRVRMGLHYGEAVVDDKDLFGDMVNTSARVEARADAGEILISASLQEKIADTGIKVINLGEETVKGKQEKITFYYVNWDNTDEQSIVSKWQKKYREQPKTIHIKKQKVVIKKAVRLEELAAKLAPPRQKGNPYLNRVMIPHPDLFYGRKGLIKRIMRRISSESPQSVSLVGERRIGKSSSLNYLSFPGTRLEYLDDPENYIFLFIDFQSLRTSEVKPLIKILFSQLEKQAGGNIEINMTADYEGMRFLCDRISSQGYRFIMLFDEFESVTKNKKIGPDFYSFFRSLANNFAVAFVTASGKNLKEMCVTKEISDSPFFNIFATHYVGLFTIREAEQLITGPSEQYQIPLAALCDKIITEGGLYPFFLQMMCSSWFEFLETEQSPAGDFLGKKTPGEVVGFFREEAYPHFEYILETLDETELEVMKKLATGTPVNPASLAVELLEKKGYINKEEDKYRFFAEEFKIFVKRSKL